MGRNTLWAAALLAACETSNAGFAPLVSSQDDAGVDGDGGGGGPPLVTPGDGDGDGDAGPSPGGDEEFDPDTVWVAVVTANDNLGFMNAESLPEGNTLIRGTARSGWITTDNRLIYEHSGQALEFVCDTPCSIKSTQGMLSTDTLENDKRVAAIGCGDLVLSRADEVWNSCGARLWTASEDEVAEPSGVLLAVHDDRIGLVLTNARLALRNLQTGDVTELDDSELHAHAGEIVPGHVRTTDDGFWVLVSAEDQGEEAVRYHVSLNGSITKDGTYLSLKIDVSSWPLGPGTLAADGTMYRVLHYTNHSINTTNDSLVRIELDKQPTYEENVLIDTGVALFKQLDATISGP